MKKKKIEEHEEGLEANIRLKSFRATVEKIQNWKTPGYDSIKRILF